jgi:serine/threonine protein kinase
MKEISKVKALIKKSINSIRMERAILKDIHYNFISNLYFSFQDKDFLYLIIDYYPGGDLRFYLEQNIQFNEKQIKFFVANIVLSLRYLRLNNILHRDIKPDNLVFDKKGYLNLTDFGISKKVKNNKIIKDKSGTPGYLSPEVFTGKNQTFSSDYFSLGIIIYELIFLERPFKGKTKQELAENILDNEINLTKDQLPNNFINSPNADNLVDFINKLLKRKKEKRLGHKDINEIINHQWLKDINWDNLESKMLLEENIPFIPSPGDNFNFLKVNNHLNKKEKNYKSYLKLINNSTLFNNFYYNFYSSNSKKSEESTGRNSMFDRRNSYKKEEKEILKEEEKNESNGDDDDEYTLNENEFNDDEEEIVFNRLSEHNGRISDINDDNKIHRYSYSPRKNK